MRKLSNDCTANLFTIYIYTFSKLEYRKAKGDTDDLFATVSLTEGIESDGRHPGCREKAESRPKNFGKRLGRFKMFHTDASCRLASRKRKKRKKQNIPREKLPGTDGGGSQALAPWYGEF